MDIFIGSGKSSVRLRTSINLVLLFLLAFAVARFTWKLRSGGPGEVQYAKEVPARGAGKTSHPGHLPGAAALLFGSSASEPAVSSPALPETTLALVLKGTVVPSAGAPYAIVAEKKGGVEQVVSIGEKVAGGAVVERILPDRIEILRNGRREVLLVVEAEPAASAGVTVDSANSWRVAAAYRKRWLNDLPTLGRKVRAQPVKDKNGRVGFRLISRDKEILKSVGLKSGDVIYEVNGVPLNNPAQALKAAGELMKSKEVTVLFGHDGQVESRVYRMEE